MGVLCSSKAFHRDTTQIAIIWMKLVPERDKYILEPVFDLMPASCIDFRDDPNQIFDQYFPTTIQRPNARFGEEVEMRVQKDEIW